MVARDGCTRKIPRAVTSCAECFAWGETHAQGVCLACYNFSAPHFGHHVGDCGACGRRVPLKQGYCRLCWFQAREDRAIAAEDARSRVVLAPYLPRVRCQQLFFAGMTKRRGRPRTTPRRYGEKGRPHKPPPTPRVRPASTGTQLALVSAEDLPRSFAAVRFDLRSTPAPDNPWLAWALYLAHATAEARGWSPIARRAMQRTLVRLLANYDDGDLVKASEARAIASRFCVNVNNATDILDRMGILIEDRTPTFELWLEAKLEGLAPGIDAPVRDWVRVLSDGGPRSRARHPDTVRAYLRSVLPALRDWTTRYDHLREVTHDDVLAYLAPLQGSARDSTVTALRSLFTWARRNGVIFRNPATRIRLRKRAHRIWQSLTDADLADAVAAATTPQARLCVVLAAVHAARPGQIRALKLDDIRLGDRRLTIAGTTRPLDELTHRVLLDWLDHRRRRWPHTANPHLLISKETALHHGPVSATWILNLRRLRATLERLRIDRQLEEALASGGDPLRLATVFGISHTAAVRYAVNALRLLEDDHAATPSDPLRTRASAPENGGGEHSGSA